MYYIDNNIKDTCNVDKKKEKLEKLKKEYLNKDFKIVYSIKEAEEIFEKESKYSYIEDKNGWILYQPLFVNGNRITITSRVEQCPLLDAKKLGIIDLTIKNKIPGKLFQDILNNFYYIYKDSGNEAAAQIYRNRETNNYFVYYPKQVISSASVSYNEDPKPRELRVKNELVCELHSHNKMKAFWSSTDDNNEKEVCFYVVVGSMDSNTISYKASVKYDNSRIDIKLEDMFDFEGKNESDILSTKSITLLDKNTADIASKIIKPSVQNVINIFNTSVYNTNKVESINLFDDTNYFDTIDNNNINTNVDTSVLCNYTTKRYVEYIVNTYLSLNKPSNFETYLNILKPVKDCINISNKINCNMYDSIIVGGCDLPKIYNYNNTERIFDTEYYFNIKARVNASILKLMFISGDYPYNINLNTIYNEINSMDNKKLYTDCGYKANIFWETLPCNAKIILADLFNTSIPELATYLFEEGELSYNVIKFLYTAILCDDDFIPYLRGCIDCISSDFENVLSSIGVDLSQIPSYIFNGSDIEKIISYLTMNTKYTFEELINENMFTVIE